MDINAQVARRLDEVADLLAEQGANLFRVQAYQRGAQTVRCLACPVDEILAVEGVAQAAGHRRSSRDRDS
jgi:putative hydrolase